MSKRILFTIEPITNDDLNNDRGLKHPQDTDEKTIFPVFAIFGFCGVSSDIRELLCL